MYPTLLSWGELRFHSYTVMMTLAFLVGALGPNWLNIRRKEPYPATPAGGIWIFIGGILGAKIYWVIQYGGWEDLRYLQFIFTGGLVFFGGLMGGIVAGIAYLKYARTPFFPAADMVTPFLAFAHGLGRIGCFLNGCCWGRLCSDWLPWGVSFPRASYGPFRAQVRQKLIEGDAAFSLPIHPVQLYETLGLFILFALLLIIYKKHRHTGVVSLSYVTLYGLLRLITEGFRGESTRSVLGMLTVSQTVGLAMFVLGGLLFLLLKTTLWKKRPENISVKITETPEEERG
ncbi:MAG: prolipoprotein diacylglyceryl transferase [Candidatus Hydrogenedens sp.]|jgi:phosphatidylglycerol:prolipoprotein diacylglycerol transferase|nr:prolipoprotein diacylglyceryl transferase [Candidatus Hydrogenedens sp.]